MTFFGLFLKRCHLIAPKTTVIIRSRVTIGQEKLGVGVVSVLVLEVVNTVDGVNVL
ncbi:MAG: hypothetical protein ACFFCZ_18055 [Promethearchaeota archaeon]